MQKKINQTITNIDVSDDQMIITLENGVKLIFMHYQDCCESVTIYDFKGDPHKLVGKKLVMVEDEVLNEIPEDVDYTPYDSFTWTNIKLVTNDETVVCRWIGESNGYYGEEVSIKEIK